MNITSKELRQRARGILGNKIFGRKWMMALLVYFVLSIIMSASISIFEKTYYIGAFYYSFKLDLPLVSIILGGTVMFGMCKTFLWAARTNNEMNFALAFDGFKTFKKTFLLGLFEKLYILLWTLLLIVPGIIKSYSYSMCYYIMEDHPEYTWRECLDESERIMKGNRWRLFCLDLSFIGWFIVGLLCLGVGVLWVYPYHYTARAEFYNELVGYVAPTEEEPILDDYL